MDEVTEQEVKTAVHSAGVVSLDLRRRGYDATVHAEDHGDYVTVEIRIRVPRLGVPVESEVG